MRADVDRGNLEPEHAPEHTRSAAWGHPALKTEGDRLPAMGIVLSLVLLVVAVAIMFYLLPAWIDSGAVSVHVQP